MKEEQKVITQSEKRKGFRINRRLSIVMFCFFVATIFWLLLALSKDYPSTVSFPIVYKNLPGKKVIVNDLPDSIALEIKATGFKILAYNFSGKRKALEIDVASRLMSGRKLGEVLALPTKAFSSDFERQFGPEIKIFGYKPDSIIFYFSDLLVKRLAVKLNIEVEFDRQFDYAGEMRIFPDSIDVSGPPSIVNSLSQVESEKLVLKSVNDKIDKSVRLKKDRLLTYNVDKVQVKVPVEKFTEGNVNVRIQALNVPVGYSLKTFPDRVNIRYMVALSKFKEVNEHQFDAIVNADTASSLHPEKLQVELVRHPEFVHSLFIDPEKVDYILRKQ